MSQQKGPEELVCFRVQVINSTKKGSREENQGRFQEAIHSYRETINKMEMRAKMRKEKKNLLIQRINVINKEGFW